MKGWRWRKAGPDHMVPRIILILSGVLLASAGATGLWVLYAHGGNRQAVAADSMAEELWGQHIPAYTVSVQNGNGSVQQTGIVGMQVSLSASTQQALVGQSVTLTATASEDVSGYELAIYDVTSGQWVGQAVTSGTQATATVSQTSPGAHQYVAYIGSHGNSPVSASSPVQVTWNAFQMDLQASPNTNVFPGQPVTISGQVMSNGSGVPGLLVSVSANGGSVSPSQVTTDNNGNFTATFTPLAAGTYTITATCLGQSASTSVQVRPALSVSLQASASDVSIGQDVTLTATVNQDVAPYALDILDETTGQWVAGPVTNGTTLTANVSQSTPSTHTYVAFVGNANSTSGTLAQSTAVHVTWYPMLTVGWNTSTWPPSLTITGYGFGNTSQVTPGMLMIDDPTQGWRAGHPGDAVQPQVQSWTNTGVVVSGFAGYGLSDQTNWTDGNGSWVFRPGDQLTIQVVNPQTGTSQSTNVTYPTSASMPTVTINPISLAPGAQTNITGHVSFNGQPLANQVVNVAVSAGTLGGTAYANNASEHFVTTDGNGDFSIPYTAPQQAGSVQVTVMADGVTATQTLSVMAPQTITVYSGAPLPTPTQDFYFTIPPTANNTWTLYLDIWNAPSWTYVYLRNLSTGQVIQVTPTMATNDNSCPNLCYGNASGGFGNTTPYTYMIPVPLTPGTWDLYDSGSYGYISLIQFAQN